MVASTTDAILITWEMTNFSIVKEWKESDGCHTAAINSVASGMVGSEPFLCTVSRDKTLKAWLFSDDSKPITKHFPHSKWYSQKRSLLLLIV